MWVIKKGTRWKSRFQKHSFADLKLSVLKNFLNSTGKHLRWSLFLIELQRLQHSRFPVKFAAFPITPFFTEEFQWLLLKFNPYFQRSLERMSVQLSAINTRFSWKKVFPASKIQKQLRRCYVKESLQGPTQM